MYPLPLEGFLLIMRRLSRRSRREPCTGDIEASGSLTRQGMSVYTLSIHIRDASRPTSTALSHSFIHPLPHSPTHSSPNLSSYFSMSATLSALAEEVSKRSSTHSSTSFLASSSPITRWPMHSTCALLDSTLRSTLYGSCAVTARIPDTLFAEIATPSPVPQIRSARSACRLRGGLAFGRLWLGREEGEGRW